MQIQRAMMGTLQVIVISLLLGLANKAQAAETYCQPEEGHSTFSLSQEIAGNRNYNGSLVGPGWSFQLRRAEFGWDIRLMDSDGFDLSRMTPPLRSDTNPRQIYGWHFRNSDNSGPNRGEVNAPQMVRLFGFSSSLSGTGGYRPNREGDVDPPDQPGCGVLTIEDIGLADLEEGERARANYLKFKVFLSWPKTEQERAREKKEAAALDDHSHLSSELIETLGGCGMDLIAIAIDTYLAPTGLSGDFDGDGSHDLAVPIFRVSDGKHGIAICRAGTWLHLLGLFRR